MISWVSSLFTNLKSVLRIRIPDPNIFYPRSRIHMTEFKYFNPKKIVSKLSEIWFGLFIPDPDPQHCMKCWVFPGGGGGAQQGGGGPADGGEVALQPDLLRRQRLRGRGAPASLVMFIPSNKVAVRSRTFLRLSGCGTIRSGSGTAISDSDSTYVLLVSIGS